MATVLPVPRVNDPLALGAVTDLARRGAWLGMPRPGWLQMFTGCALGPYYDTPADSRGAALAFVPAAISRTLSGAGRLVRRRGPSTEGVAGVDADLARPAGGGRHACGRVPNKSSA